MRPITKTRQPLMVFDSWIPKAEHLTDLLMPVPVLHSGGDLGGHGKIELSSSEKFLLELTKTSFSPGRFYVSIVMKMIVSEFIMNYDIKLVDIRAPRLMAWSIAMVPHSSMRILLRKKSPLTFTSSPMIN